MKDMLLFAFDMNCGTSITGFVEASRDRSSNYTDMSIGRGYKTLERGFFDGIFWPM